MTSNRIRVSTRQRAGESSSGRRRRQIVSSGDNLDRWLAFAFGIIFVSVLLYLATAVQNPSAFTIRVYVTVLALAAAGVGAILPGFLEIRYKNLLRAGGALALFVLVYFNEPAIGSKIPRFVEPASSPTTVVDSFLKAISLGNPAESWALLPDDARDLIKGGETTWDNLYKNVVAPLGPVESRSLVGETRIDSPPGFPPGIYRSFSYKSKFKGESGFRNEIVVVRANASDKWEVFSYQISLGTL
jgi:hypothetical protein